MTRAQGGFQDGNGAGVTASGIAHASLGGVQNREVVHNGCGLCMNRAENLPFDMQGFLQALQCAVWFQNS